MIEAYCNHELSDEKRREFEQRIVGDPLFAEEVAFYFSTKQLAASAMIEKRADLRRVFEEYKKEKPLSKQPALMRRILPWVAVAAVLAAIAWGLTIFRQPSSYKELADKYVKENLSVLSVTMGSKQDSLQAGLALYNEGKLQEAQKQFESLVTSDTASVEAKKICRNCCPQAWGIRQSNKSLRSIRKLYSPLFQPRKILPFPHSHETRSAR